MSIQLSGDDVVDMAVETEARGEEFYRNGAASAADPAVRSLFEYLATEELRHKQVFQALAGKVALHDKAPGAMHEALEYVSAVVASAFFTTRSPLQAALDAVSREQLLEWALAFEKETLLFFYGLRELVRPADRGIVDEVIQEERHHIVRLNRVLGGREGASGSGGGI